MDNAIIQLGDIDDSQKGRQFKSRFIQAGIAGYPKQFGNVLITKETLDKFVNTLVNKPVIINHKDEIKPEDEVGKVTKVWFNSEDGWFWCEGYLTDETAINLIKDKGWSVSCSYDVLLLDDEGGTENNIKYDKEFLNGKFTHLAIVENPRYERANIVVNSKTEIINNEDDDYEDIRRIHNDRWITVHPNGEDEKGRHLLIQDGEDLKEAMQRQWGVYDKRQAKLKSDDKAEKWENEPSKWGKEPNQETQYRKEKWEEAVKKYQDIKKKNSDWNVEKQETKDALAEERKAYKNLEEARKNSGMLPKYESLKDISDKDPIEDWQERLDKIAEEVDFYDEKKPEAEPKQDESFEKETPYSQKNEDKHNKVRDLEDKAYKEFKKTYDNYINGDVKISDFGKAKEQFNKKYKDAFDKLGSDRFVSFEDFAKRENKQPDKSNKDTFEKLDEEAKSLPDNEKEAWEAYKETSIPPYFPSKKFEDLAKRYDELEGLNQPQLSEEEALKQIEEHAGEKRKQKQEKQSDSPFGEGVKEIAGGRSMSGGKTVGYIKDNKGVSIEEFGDGVYKVNYYYGTTLKEIKYYATEKGMQKSVKGYLQAGESKEAKALETKSNLEEKENTYKEVLKRYQENDRKRWQSGLSNAEYYKAYDEAEKAKKELTTARREYAESIMANFEQPEDNPYQDKIDAKRGYYQEKSDDLQKSSERNWQLHEQTRLPLGQPIINPATARAYKRTNGYFDKSLADYNKSKYYAEKANSYGSHGISADDANAIAKLAQKYKSGVTSAEKRRIIDRVIDIHRNRQAASDTSKQTDYSNLGFQVERNADINRLQLKFDGKPDEKTRSILKSNGFRWSPREGAWQRQLNGNSEYGLKRVVEGLQKVDNSLTKGIKKIFNSYVPTAEDIPLLQGLIDIFEKNNK